MSEEKQPDPTGDLLRKLVQVPKVELVRERKKRKRRRKKKK